LNLSESPTPKEVPVMVRNLTMMESVEAVGDLPKKERRYFETCLKSLHLKSNTTTRGRLPESGLRNECQR
jgi:hypothetical protein